MDRCSHSLMHAETIALLVSTISLPNNCVTSNRQLTATANQFGRLTVNRSRLYEIVLLVKLPPLDLSAVVIRGRSELPTQSQVSVASFGKLTREREAFFVRLSATTNSSGQLTIESFFRGRKTDGPIFIRLRRTLIDQAQLC